MARLPFGGFKRTPTTKPSNKSLAAINNHIVEMIFSKCALLITKIPTPKFGVWAPWKRSGGAGLMQTYY